MTDITDEDLNRKRAYTNDNELISIIDSLLQAREGIAELEKQVEWISVDDELPEIDQYVQGYSHGKFHRLYLGEILHTGNNEWIFFNDNKDIFTVTHWMDIPLLPIQQNDPEFCMGDSIYGAPPKD